MNEEDGFSVVLQPCSSEPLETADPRSGERCHNELVGNNSEIPGETNSLDAVEDEGVGGEDSVCRTVELPPVADLDEGTIRELEAQVEVSAEDGVAEVETSDSLPLAQKDGVKGEERGMEKEEELSMAVEKQGELVEVGENMVKEEESDSVENVKVEVGTPIFGEGGKSLEKGEDKVTDEKIHSRESANVQEVPSVPGESGKSIGDGKVLSEVKIKELNGEEEPHGPNDNDGELGGNQETEGAMQKEDELNEEESIQVNGNEEMAVEEHTGILLEVKIKELNGEEETHILHKKDGAFRGKHENEGVMKLEDEFKGEEEPLQVTKDEAMAREEQTDPLLEVKIKELNGEKETRGLNENDGEVRCNHETEGVMRNEDESNGEEEPLQVNGYEEMAEEEQTDGIDSPPVAEEDKEMTGEEQAQDIDDLQIDGDTTKGNELISEDEIEETGTQMKMDMEGEAEVETPKSGTSGKRKRGKNTKVPPKASRKLVGEDVCFICLDGGDLVLCDRRGCPKAYHPSCVNRDEAFFRTKGRWNCGWHLCSKCEKNAYYMCCTCTFSLCKGCIKDAVIFCVRGSRGLCETCMKSVMLIENNERGNDEVVFDDKSQWEFLFKDYWIEQKEKLSITSEELAQAQNPWKGCDADDKQETPAEIHDSDIEAGNGSDSSFGDVGGTSSKRKKNNKQLKSSAKEKDSDTDSSTGKPDVSKTKGKAKRRMKPPTKGANSDSDNSTGHQGKTVSRRKKAKKLSKSHGNVGDLTSQTAASGEGVGAQGSTEWASKELLELVMYMRNGDRSVLSHFEVQKLLLDYITMNKLRDPRLRSQIICDSMLQKLFGKPRVAHFEMLKLLESHFLVNEDSQGDDNHGSVVDTEVSQLDIDENTDSLMGSRSKGRKARRKGDERGFQSNLDDYASIDMHNISLIYLRRNLMEALMEDSESFHDKVVGSFVRIRISGSGQKQDIYRLVQVVGTSKAADPYTVGKRTADIMLEILNLDKTETVSIDTISNQEFTEDECKRLRQSIKCGLISRLTVGDVLEKAKELHEVRVTDWLQAEITRLRHLCDRASDLGRKRELRECVEKLELLKTPEERQRRLDEIPKVHADPNMDPSYISEDDNEMDNRRQESNMRWRENVSFRSKDQFSSRKGGSTLNDSWSATTKLSNRKWETGRNIIDKGYSGRREYASAMGEVSDRNAWRQGGDKGTSQFYSWDKSKTTSDPILSKQAEYAQVITNMSPPAESENSQPVSTAVAPADATDKKTEKVWHYKDPSGKVQGPFSMVQLRKWSKTGFFPAELKIWRTTRSEDDSILLTEALAGRFQKEPLLVVEDSSEAQGALTPHLLPANMVKGYGSLLLHGNRGRGAEMLRGDQNCGAGNAGSSVVSSSQSQLEMGRSRADITSKGSVAPTSVETSKFPASGHGPDTGCKYDLSNLPSPTPAQNAAGWTRKQNYRSRWSDASVSLQSSSSTMETGSKGGNIVLSSPNLASSEAHLFMKSNPPSSEPSPGMDRVPSKEANVPRNKEDNLPSAGEVLPGSGFSVAPPNISALNLPGGSPRVQESAHLLLPPPNTATSLMNAGQGVSNVASSGAVQNPPVYGWGTGFVARPEIMNPGQIPGNGQAWGLPGLQNNPNAMSAQQPANGYWANAPINSAPQSYGAGQFAGPENFSAPNFAGMPSPNPWRPPVSPAPTNMQWGVAAPENPGVAPTSNTAWGPVTANPNMGLGGAAVGLAPGPPATTAAFGLPPGAAAGHLLVGPAVAPGLPPGNTNMSWLPTGNANSAPTENPNTWGSEQNHNCWGSQRHKQSSFGSAGPPAQTGRGVCKFYENGHCKKGASCNFLHN
ncbi:hypothetical protein Ancab_018048 [Ancistrocladus abbreviatus]